MQLNITIGGVVPGATIASPAESPVTTHGDVRDLLKTHTHSLHIGIERVLDLPARTRDLGSYRALLAQFYGFYRPLELKLARVGGYEDVALDFDTRRKELALLVDLLSLGMTADEVHALPHCDDLPVVDSLAHALGCLYVLEGSTLGGQIITRLVADRLNLVPGDGASFFASYGESVGALWTQFCDALEAHGRHSPARREIMLASAQATFVKLQQWIARLPA